VETNHNVGPMTRTLYLSALSFCVALCVVACAKNATAPSTPGATQNPDGSLLKATAPTLQTPVNGVKLAQGAQVVLVLTNSTTSYTNGVALSYRLEVSDMNGTVAESTLVPAGAGTTSRTVAAALTGDQTYQWRARPEYQGTAGPWSAKASFVAPP